MSKWRERFRYDPTTGDLIRLHPKWAARNGAICSSLNKDGYGKVMFLRRSYLTHRVCWLLHFGEWPKLQIDHVNGVRFDNRIENLRLATAAQNACNKRGRGDKLKGVSFHISIGKFVGRIRANGRMKHLGVFDTEEEAHQAYQKAAKLYHGEFARFA